MVVWVHAIDSYRRAFPPAMIRLCGAKLFLPKRAFFRRFLAVNHPLVTTIKTEEGYCPSVYQLLCGGA
jgi:hypothetical protein